jgi:hypothetical protein
MIITRLAMLCLALGTAPALILKHKLRHRDAAKPILRLLKSKLRLPKLFLQQRDALNYGVNVLPSNGLLPIEQLKR